MKSSITHTSPHSLRFVFFRYNDTNPNNDFHEDILESGRHHLAPLVIMCLQGIVTRIATLIILNLINRSEMHMPPLTCIGGRNMMINKGKDRRASLMYMKEYRSMYQKAE